MFRLIVQPYIYKESLILHRINLSGLINCAKVTIMHILKASHQKYEIVVVKKLE